ncbi:hypothetical protein PPROV_000510800 [Pycnococcus provasolii]|uniref:NADH dehydrogenase [ubiquinone] 1 alpha subcomplex subunit 5 n=1 Tax=Pycnococcus provasolii TaxID=41880 RepID=A0A830HHT5_9CHLO|nr:hypothetical protein PPROV_000510800 [Pycnococcus provasolii]
MAVLLRHCGTKLRGGLKTCSVGFSTPHLHLRAFASAKETTGIVGLKPEADWRAKLTAVYEKTLAEASMLPDSAAYKKLLVALTNERLAAVGKAEDYSALEDAVACGQVEQLLQQAEDELGVLELMKREKPWEVPTGHAVPVLQFKPGSEHNPNFDRWSKFDWPGPGKP